jgi:hypothetical protein
MNKNQYAYAIGFAALSMLAGCAVEPNAGETSESSASAVTASPLTCSDLAGTWKATIGGGSTVTVFGGTQPLVGSIDFTLSPASASTETFQGTLNITLAGLPPIAAPLSALTIGCDGSVAIDAMQSFPAVGAVHFVVNGSINQVAATAGSFRVDSVPGALIPLSANGSLSFKKQ